MMLNKVNDIQFIHNGRLHKIRIMSANKIYNIKSYITDDLSGINLIRTSELETIVIINSSIASGKNFESKLYRKLLKLYYSNISKDKQKLLTDYTTYIWYGIDTLKKEVNNADRIRSIEYLIKNNISLSIPSKEELITSLKII